MRPARAKPVRRKVAVIATAANPASRNLRVTGAGPRVMTPVPVRSQGIIPAAVGSLQPIKAFAAATPDRPLRNCGTGLPAAHQISRDYWTRPGDSLGAIR